MQNKERGGTYIESLIALVLILVVLNPIFFALIFLKKQVNELSEYELLENEMEKVRAFYKRTKGNNIYKSENEEFKIEITKEKLYEDMKKIEIIVKKNDKRKTSELYVYE